MISEELEMLLEQTRLALLAGDFEALDIVAGKTAAALEDLPIPAPEAILRIRGIAETNAALIGAALQGIAAARARLLRPEGFSTYDSRGQRGAVKSGDPGRPHRL